MSMSMSTPPPSPSSSSIRSDRRRRLSLLSSPFLTPFLRRQRSTSSLPPSPRSPSPPPPLPDEAEEQILYIVNRRQVAPLPSAESSPSKGGEACIPGTMATWPDSPPATPEARSKALEGCHPPSSSPSAARALRTPSPRRRRPSISSSCTRQSTSPLEQAFSWSCAAMDTQGIEEPTSPLASALLLFPLPPPRSFSHPSRAQNDPRGTGAGLGLGLGLGPAFTLAEAPHRTLCAEQEEEDRWQPSTPPLSPSRVRTSSCTSSLSSAGSKTSWSSPSSTAPSSPASSLLAELEHLAPCIVYAHDEDREAEAEGCDPFTRCLRGSRELRRQRVSVGVGKGIGEKDMMARRRSMDALLVQLEV